MNKPLLCLAALLIASPAFSGESRMHTTRDGGSYEATLRQAGIPLAGGMAWETHQSGTAVRASAQRTTYTRATTTPVNKAG